MSEETEEAGEKKMLIFGYPLKDYLLFFTMLGGFLGGAAGVAGTPNQIKDAVTEDLSELYAKVDSIASFAHLAAQISQRNTLRQDDLEAAMKGILRHVDSTHTVQMQSFKNLDGYFRSLPDKPNPDQ